MYSECCFVSLNSTSHSVQSDIQTEFAVVWRHSLFHQANHYDIGNILIMRPDNYGGVLRYNCSTLIAKPAHVCLLPLFTHTQCIIGTMHYALSEHCRLFHHDVTSTKSHVSLVFIASRGPGIVTKENIEAFYKHLRWLYNQNWETTWKRKVPKYE